MDKDPDCLQNLIDLPIIRKLQNKLQKLLEEWMVKTGDPILEVFVKGKIRNLWRNMFRNWNLSQRLEEKRMNKFPKTKKKKKS